MKKIDNKNLIYKKNHFKTCRNISWDDVISKISNEIDCKSYGLILNDINNFPTIVMANTFLPNTISQSFCEVQKDCDITTMHMYVSFSNQCDTFGRHKDETDVLIVQAINKVSYKIDDVIYDLSPGDSLFIKAKTFHEPIIYGPRVTLSFSWE